MTKLSYSFLLKADKLAVENELSRKTKSVGIDTARNEVTVVEEVAHLNGETGSPIREERYYFVSDLSKVGIQEAIAKARFLATFTFLGESIESVTVPQEQKANKISAEVVERSLEEMHKKAEAKTPVNFETRPEIKPLPLTKSETKEEVKEEKPKKKRFSRKKKELVTEVSTKLEESPVQAEDDKNQEIEPVVNVKPTRKSKPILFDRNKIEHSVILTPVLNENFEGWNKDKECEARKKVVVLVGKLHDSVPITNKKGEVLDSFFPTVDKYISEIKSGESLPW